MGSKEKRFEIEALEIDQWCYLLADAVEKAEVSVFTTVVAAFEIEALEIVRHGVLWRLPSLVVMQCREILLIFLGYSVMAQPGDCRRLRRQGRGRMSQMPGILAQRQNGLGDGDTIVDPTSAFDLIPKVEAQSRCIGCE